MLTPCLFYSEEVLKAPLSISWAENWNKLSLLEHQSWNILSIFIFLLLITFRRLRKFPGIKLHDQQALMVSVIGNCPILFFLLLLINWNTATSVPINTLKHVCTKSPLSIRNSISLKKVISACITNIQRRTIKTGKNVLAAISSIGSRNWIKKDCIKLIVKQYWTASLNDSMNTLSRLRWGLTVRFHRGI